MSFLNAATQYFNVNGKRASVPKMTFSSKFNALEDKFPARLKSIKVAVIPVTRALHVLSTLVGFLRLIVENDGQ